MGSNGSSMQKEEATAVTSKKSEKTKSVRASRDQPDPLDYYSSHFLLVSPRDNASYDTGRLPPSTLAELVPSVAGAEVVTGFAAMGVVLLSCWTLGRANPHYMSWAVQKSNSVRPPRELSIRSFLSSIRHWGVSTDPHFSSHSPPSEWEIRRAQQLQMTYYRVDSTPDGVLGALAASFPVTCAFNLRDINPIVHTAPALRCSYRDIVPTEAAISETGRREADGPASPRVGSKRDLAGQLCAGIITSYDGEIDTFLLLVPPVLSGGHMVGVASANIGAVFDLWRVVTDYAPSSSSSSAPSPPLSPLPSSPSFRLAYRPEGGGPGDSNAEQEA
jgi:hypothetical protein